MNKIFTVIIMWSLMINLYAQENTNVTQDSSDTVSEDTVNKEVETNIRFLITKFSSLTNDFFSSHLSYSDGDMTDTLSDSGLIELASMFFAYMIAMATDKNPYLKVFSVVPAFLGTLCSINAYKKRECLERDLETFSTSITSCYKGYLVLAVLNEYYVSKKIKDDFERDDSLRDLLLTYPELNEDITELRHSIWPSSK